MTCGSIFKQLYFLVKGCLALHLICWVARSYQSLVAKMWLLCESWLVERDIAVWNHKSWVDQPLFATKEDRIIKKFRQWYEQFYSDKSLTFREATRKQVPIWDW